MIQEMPDYNSALTMQTEQARGPFNYEKYNFVEVGGQLIHDGPFEI